MLVSLYLSRGQGQGKSGFGAVFVRGLQFFRAERFVHAKAVNPINSKNSL